MEIVLLFIIFIVLLAVGAPIGTSLGVAAIVTILHYHLGIQMIEMNFISGIGGFPLLAIPFFVLAGMFFQQSGLARTIANFLKLLVGNLTGGMAMVAVITATFWGALSGSGPATTAAVGLILVAGMVEQGYDKNFAAATIATSSDLSIVIPPSIAFIIYGNITGTSVSALFAAGVFPGILTSIFLVITAYLISKRRGYRGVSEKRATTKEILIAFINSFWALLAPVIILGGIYGGIFTPTEAAVVAVFYSLFITVFVYKTLIFSKFIKILRDAAVTSSVIMFIVVFAGMFFLDCICRRSD
jgi:C4-dicarboxylate transporter DctM subunit